MRGAERAWKTNTDIHAGKDWTAPGPAARPPLEPGGQFYALMTQPIAAVQGDLALIKRKGIGSRGVPSAILVLALLGCMPQPGRAQADAKPDPAWNHVARLLAGMPAQPGSPYATVARTRAFRIHQTYMDRFWNAVDKGSLKPISAWGAQQLSQIDGNRTAVYPLSGADFVNLYLMYPRAPRYLMFALEQPGTPPSTVPTEPKALGQILGSLRAVIDTIASKNYFYSAHMRTHLRYTPMQGTAPPLMAFLARLGMDLRNVEPVMLNNAGVLVTCPAADCHKSSFPGMRYTFRAPGETRDRELVYLSLKVQKDSLEPTTPSGKYLGSLPPFNAMMKSAIYLLFEPQFAGVRAWMHRSCRVLIQDDSGMPFTGYATPDWNVRLFGRYVTYTYSIGGIGRPPKQKELVERYRKGPTTPVGFRFGYGGLGGPQSSTLMVIEKKGDAGAP